jgi:low affinity Fe/Cu permease
VSAPRPSARKGSATRRGGPPHKGVGWALEELARCVTDWTGGSWAFAVALGTIVVWGVTGPLFRFSDTWQLVINTGTTIITFLMVFLIQRSQNKDSRALHLKLNEIVAALNGASNRLINVEDLTETEIRLLHDHYQRLVAMAKRDLSLTESHSVEEAEQRHRAKQRAISPGADAGALEGGVPAPSSPPPSAA